jgi:hypothetical protein
MLSFSNDDIFLACFEFHSGQWRCFCWCHLGGACSAYSGARTCVPISWQDQKQFGPFRYSSTSSKDQELSGPSISSSSSWCSSLGVVVIVAWFVLLSIWADSGALWMAGCVLLLPFTIKFAISFTVVNASSDALPDTSRDMCLCCFR